MFLFRQSPNGPLELGFADAGHSIDVLPHQLERHRAWLQIANQTVGQ
jgi:hypothetical protein